MPHPEQPSYKELAARNAELTARFSELLAVVAEQAALIETLRTEVAALRRQARRDSSNSSQPPSRDSPAAGAKAKGARQAARRARPARPQGGQKGHRGASLAWAARPDETRVIEPGTCGGCGADLADATGRVARAVQVLDIPVPLQNCRYRSDQRVSASRYAARWYSLMTPPRTFRRCTGASSGMTAISSWSGGRCCRDWCGRCPL